MKFLITPTGNGKHRFRKIPEAANLKIVGVYRYLTSDTDPTEAEMAALFVPDALLALKTQCTNWSQDRLDSLAQSWDYDNIISLCDYRDSSVPRFAAEGQAGYQARDDEWAAADAYKAAVLAGTAEPTFDAYKAAMPTLPARPSL